MLFCEYGVTLKAPVLKNIWERLLGMGGTDKEIYISTQELLEYCWMYEAVFKCDKNSTSLQSKLLFFFPTWLVLEKCGVWFDV